MNVYKYFMLIFAVAVMGCSDSNDPDPGPDPGPELDPLKVPVNLKVAKVGYDNAVVTWDGDTTATAYEVKFIEADETIRLQGTSCGVDGLASEQNYNWEVRAIRYEETTAWIAGVPFKTTEYFDFKDDWTGTWYSREWDLVISFVGYEIPIDDYLTLIPDSLNIDEILELMVFDMEQDKDNEDIILVKLPILEGFDLPTAISLPLEDEQFIYSVDPEFDLPLVSEPTDISNFPIITEIPGLKGLLAGKDLMIEELTFKFNRIRFVFGPYVEYNESIPFTGSIEAIVTFKTDNAIVNLGISVLQPKLKVVLTSKLFKKE